MSCPICGAATKQLLVHSGWNHDRCSECGHVFLTDLPSEAACAEFYSTTENQQWNTNAFAVLDAYLRNPAALQRYYHRDRVRRLGDVLREGATVFDIGCGSGVFLATLRDAGMRVTGHDLSAPSVAAGRRELGINLLSGPLGKTLGPFDVITSYDVIEHWTDPGELVRTMRSLCHGNTTVAVRTPNHASWLRAVTGHRWLWYMPPAHIHLFTAASLCRLLEKHGFVVTSVRTLASSYIYFVAHYLAGGLISRGSFTLDMPRWKELTLCGADRLLRLALSPLLIPAAHWYGNPLLEVHARPR